MKCSSVLVYGLVIGITATAAIARQDNPTPKHLMREDSAAVNALAMYPDTIRLHIFESCEYPAAIVSIATLQKKTSSDFADLISGYSKDEQEDFWNLARYPDLISLIVQGGKKTADEINTILIDYPADIHQAALKCGTDYFDQLQQMDEMQGQTDSQFAQIIADYPQETQDALRDIIRYPEIINLLNDHLSLTVRVGDRFRRDPQRVIHRADSLNLVETRQSAEDAEAWKQTLAQNPDEAQDLQNAANDYATENGYTQDDVNAQPNPDQVANYSCTPYSYWFGYPTWYPYSYWYPYPFWFDCGFYRDRGGRIVMIGSPSFYFTNWYFYSPEHWHRYPNLCNAYIDHYYGPRRSVGSNTLIVHSWVRENRNYLPKDFVTSHTQRTDVIRQVAQLHIDVQKQQNAGRPVSATVRDQYFQNNKSKYSLLNAEPVKRTKTEERQDNTPDIREIPVKQPAVKISDEINQPAITPRPGQVTARPTPVTTRPTPVTTRPSPVTPRPAAPAPAVNFNSINKAQEFHRNVWEQTQPVARPQPQPAPRMQIQQPMRQEPVRQEPMNRPAPPKKP